MKFWVQTAHQQISLAEGQTQTWEQLLRLGSFTDSRYGRFEITPDLFQSLIQNFQSGTFGQKIFVDVAHDPDQGAAGEIVGLKQTGDWLLAQIAWTPFGIDAVRQKGFSYLSAEYTDNYQDNETGNFHGALLLGSGLTLRPVIKRQKSISLSEDQRLLIDPILLRQASMKFDELKTRLQQDLAALTLSEAVIQQLLVAFTTAGKDQTDEVLESLMTQFTATGKTLAETKPEPGQTIQLTMQGSGLSKAEVINLWQEQEAARNAAIKQLAETTASLCKLFVDTVDAEKGLPEDIRKILADEGVKIINPTMTDDNVKALAATQLKLGQQIAASRQLASLGYRPQGSVHITVDESNTVKALQDVIDKRLGIIALADTDRFRNTGGALQSVNKVFAEKVLARFDHLWGRQLHQEHKLLAAGSGIASDISVPKIWERTVIRESLYNLVGLSFVNAGVETFAAEYSIPYSYRDTTAAGIDSTRVYEGLPIQNSGVIQTTESAYNLPQKLAFEIHDEMRYLTDSRLLDWDAVTEKTNNAIRIINEDTDRLIFNEIIQASDAYGAIAVSNENLELQADGAKKIFVLAQWPVCRPKKVYDLHGTQIGNTVHPITVTYNSVALSEWSSGVGAGTYYIIDYNLGEIRLVNASGVNQIPADGTTYTISYSYTTNVYKFDVDLGSDSTGAHWDKFLYQYGLRKSVIEDSRYHMANFGLMSGAVFSLIEQATQFSALGARSGTDLLANGNLGRIKDVPNSKAIAPGLWMADQRIIIGERGITRFRIAKPWQMGELDDVHDSNGKFLGKRAAYGDQFVVLLTPIPLRNAYTSIVLYSGAGRVARAS